MMAVLAWTPPSHLLQKPPRSASHENYTAFHLLYSKQSSCQDKAIVRNPAGLQTHNGKLERQQE